MEKVTIHPFLGTFYVSFNVNCRRLTMPKSDRAFALAINRQKDSGDAAARCQIRRWRIRAAGAG